MTRRFLCIALCLILLAATAACTPAPATGPSTDASASPGPGESSPGAGGSSAAPAESGPKVTLPLTTEDVTFTMFISGLGNITSSFDLEKNAFTQRIYEDTGIKLEFIAVSGAERQEKLNVLLNTGDYPDLIRDNNMTASDLQYYASEGIFLPLDEYALNYPNIKAAFDAYPDINDVLRGNDGLLYALPDVNDCLHCVYNAGRIFYHMPFLRDSGKEIPTTQAEFTEYLRYIKNEDPNGNGLNDEIPLAFYADRTKDFFSAMAKMYMPWVQTDREWGLAVENGVIVEQYRSDEFREALRYARSLYTEGLIAPDSFSMSKDELLALGEDPNASLLGTATVAWRSDFTQKGTARWTDASFVLPPLEGPTGQAWSHNKDPWSIIQPGMMITDKCSDPELAVALYNYLLEFDVMLDGYIGPKGQSWDDPDPGSVSLMGTPSEYKLLLQYGTQEENCSWDQHNPMVRDSRFRLGEQANDFETVEKFMRTGDPALADSVRVNPSYNEICNYILAMDAMADPAKVIPKECFVPPLVLDTASSTRVADIKAVLDPYKLQTFTEFVTGVRDIETGWDAYLAELDNIGSAEMVQLMQSAYDAKYK